MESTESILRRHMLNILVNIDIDATFLCFLYAYPEGEIVDRLYMEDLLSTHSKTKRAFELIMHIHRKGKIGFRAFVEAMVYTEQRHLANQLDFEMAKDFWEKRHSHYPPF